jgi:cell division protein FtsB
MAIKWMSMKTLTVILLVILGITQYTLWFSKSGVQEYFSLKHQIEQQQQKNKEFSLKNEILTHEVQHLKQDKSAIESRARNDLGMIKQSETFYQVIPSNTKNNSTV